MNAPLRRTLPRFAFTIATCFFSLSAFAQTRTIRVVTYNIEDDINGATTPLPGLIAPSGGTVQQGGVLEGIGEEILGPDPAQPLDILALQETTSNNTTVTPIVNGLNSFYNSPGMYAMSSYQATSSGGVSSGGGPNAMVYNTKTLQLLASVSVNPPGGGSLGSSSGEYRQVVRYQFAPAGVQATAANEFYVYVSHYKSGTTSSDLTARGEEAVIIRNDEANNLPATARVLYVGDYNVTTSGEASYQTIVAANAPNGIAQGQGIDPMNPTGANNIDWGTTTSDPAILAMESESAKNLRYRDDLQVMTANVYNAVPGGLALVPGTYHVFGNNGTVAYNGTVNGSSNTALNTNLMAGATISASQLRAYLTTASDHLPVVADYTIPVAGTPPVAGFSASPTNGVAPLTVLFTNTSTGTVTNWVWSFGDGTGTNTSNSSVTHTYTFTGVFSVTETVTGPGGSATNAQANLITVLTPFQAWQLQYFGCTNCPQAQPDADADGTGQNNAFKYVSGLDPTNPASIFVFGITNGPALNFSPVVAGRNYTPQFNTDLVNGTWAALDANAVTNGNQVTLTDTNAPLPQKFYRILISLP